MDATDVTQMSERAFTTLSGGEQQRVLLARAFAQEAPVLVLDEPTANLDLRHAHELMSLVRARTTRGGAALAALHDLSLAARFCDRMVVLHRGRIGADGPPAEVLTEALMRETFEVDARVRDVEGALLIDVRGSAPAPPEGRGG
jgi:iron complex transport system ATP-binding protein